MRGIVGAYKLQSNIFFFSFSCMVICVVKDVCGSFDLCFGGFHVDFQYSHEIQNVFIVVNGAATHTHIRHACTNTQIHSYRLSGFVFPQLTSNYSSDELGLTLELVRDLSDFVDFNSKFDSGAPSDL